MIEYLNFIRPDKFAIINHKKSDIIIFKNFNIKNKIIFYNKKFKYINDSEDQTFLLSDGKFFIEINKNFTWYRFINRLGLSGKKVNTSSKLIIEDIKINIKKKEIIILDNKSNIYFFGYKKNKLNLKKKLKLPIKFNCAKFDFIDYKKIFICLDNRKIIYLENFKNIRHSNIFKNARNITSLRIFNKKIILVDQRNYCLNIFNLNCKFQKKIGSKGTGEENFDLPTELNVFKKYLIIADQNNDRFLKIDNTFKCKNYKKRIIGKDNLNRPIKTLILDNLLYVLDRENNRIQIFDLNLSFIKTFKLEKIENSKPNSFCYNSVSKNFYILYRKSNLKNFIILYNRNGKRIFIKNLNTIDAQDIDCTNTNIFIANTLGRSLNRYDLKLNLKKKYRLDILSSDRRVQIKTVYTDQNKFIYTATFDNFKIFKFDKNLKLLRKFNLRNYKKHMRVLRSIAIDHRNKDKIFLLNRGKKPIWIYSFSKNKVLKKKNFTKNGFSLRNPTSISMFKKNLFICDKENDRIIKVKQ